MSDKQEFREALLEMIAEDHTRKTMEELNEGIAEGWVCRWPDCALAEYGCGTRYGCAPAKLMQQKAIAESDEPAY